MSRQDLNCIFCGVRIKNIKKQTRISEALFNKYSSIRIRINELQIPSHRAKWCESCRKTHATSPDGQYTQLIKSQGFCFIDDKSIRNHSEIISIMKTLNYQKEQLLDLSIASTVSGNTLMVDLIKLKESISSVTFPISLDTIFNAFEIIHKIYIEPLSSHFPSYVPLNDCKLLLSDGETQGQDIHIDSPVPILISALYFHDSNSEVNATIFHDMYIKESSISLLEDRVLDKKQFDSSFKLPWKDHPIISPLTVTSGTLGIFLANILHRGPPNIAGLRGMLFRTYKPANFYIDDADAEYQTYEFNYVLERYPTETQLIKESIQRHPNWRIHCSDAQIEKIQAIISSKRKASFHMHH